MNNLHQTFIANIPWVWNNVVLNQKELYKSVSCTYNEYTSGNVNISGIEEKY